MGRRFEEGDTGSGYRVGYIRVGGTYCDLHTLHSHRELPELLEWLRGPERSDRVIILVASMSRRDRRSVVRRLEMLGLKRKRQRLAERGDMRRQLRPTHPIRWERIKGLSLAVVTSLITMPVWLPATVALRLAGRGHRRLVFDGCAALGFRGRGSSGGGSGGPSGPGRPGGDRSPRRPRPGADSLAVELDVPEETVTIDPPSVRHLMPRRDTTPTGRQCPGER